MATASIKLISEEPNIINTGSELYISLPLINIGQDIAPNAFISNITLGIVPRLAPKTFPIFLGNLSSGNIVASNMKFNALNLFPGQKYLLTVRGFYGEKASPIGFAVNRYITIPDQSAYPVEMLKAHVEVKLDLNTWNYSIFNDEPKDSQQFVSAFSLTIAAPVTVTGIPSGWNVTTDNLTFVGWFSEDKAKPYPSHVGPGGSLGGFQIKSTITESESTAYILTSWRHDSDIAGLVVPDYVATPRRLL